LRGLIRSSRSRHPGASIQPAVADQLRALISQTLPGVDITQPIAV